MVRTLHAVDRLPASFGVLRQDPVLSQFKLAVEPWDLGSGGFQGGNFPAGWTEWNRPPPRRHVHNRSRYCGAEGASDGPSSHALTRLLTPQTVQVRRGRMPAGNRSDKTLASRATAKALPAPRTPARARGAPLSRRPSAVGRQVGPQNRKYLCAIGSTVAGSQASNCPSARTA